MAVIEPMALLIRFPESCVQDVYDCVIATRPRGIAFVVKLFCRVDFFVENMMPNSQMNNYIHCKVGGEIVSKLQRCHP